MFKKVSSIDEKTKPSEEIEGKYLIAYLPSIMKNSTFQELTQFYLDKNNPVVKTHCQKYFDVDLKNIDTARVRSVVNCSESIFFITLKGRGLVSRLEYEKKIPEKEYISLLETVNKKNAVNKKRYIDKITVDDYQLKAEFDCFSGKLDGLIVCEIEVPDADILKRMLSFLRKHYCFEKSEIKDVTKDHRYKNNHLSKTSNIKSLLF